MISSRACRMIINRSAYEVTNKIRAAQILRGPLFWFRFAYGATTVIITHSMSTITLDDVKYVASLAKIAITDEQAAKLQQELDTILGYVKQLDSLDTKGIEPTYQVTGLTNIMREDEIIDYRVSREDLLKNAPHQHNNQIKVPKVL